MPLADFAQMAAEPGLELRDPDGIFLICLHGHMMTIYGHLVNDEVTAAPKDNCQPASGRTRGDGI